MRSAVRRTALAACPFFLGIASCSVDAPYRRVLVEPHGFQLQKTFESAPEAYMAFCVQVPAGGCAIMSNVDPGTTRDDICITRMGEDGTSRWSRMLWQCTGCDFCLTRDGGVAAVASTRRPGGRYHLAPPPETILRKIDSDGNKVWSTILTAGRDTMTEGQSVLQTSDGGYVVAGTIGMERRHACLIKTDASGNVLWTRTFGDEELSQGWSALQTADGGYLVLGGIFRSPGSGGPDAYAVDAYAVKTDAEGRAVWSCSFGEEGDHFAMVAQQTIDGEYIVGGLTWSRDDDYDISVAKIDTLGHVKWSKSFGGAGSQHCESLGTTTDGGCVVAGSTEGGDESSSNALLIRLNRDGNEVWSRILAGPPDRCAVAVQQTTNGGLSLLCEERAAKGAPFRFALYRLPTE